MRCKIFWAMVLVFMTAANARAWWPIYRFPAVEGVVIDSTTAKPIEKVFVECSYRKSIGVLVDNVSKGIGSRVAVTDKEGRYSIPNKTGLHLLPSWFPLGGAFEYEICFQFNHPYYVFDLADINIICWNAYSDPPSWAAKKIGAKVVFNVALTSIDEKYVKKIKVETDLKKREKLLWDFGRKVDNRLEGMVWTFKKPVDPVDLDWNAVFDKYESYIEILSGDFKYSRKAYYDELVEHLATARKEFSEYRAQKK